MIDLALIFFFCLVVLNYRAQRSVLYPPFVFCAMWLLDLMVLRLNSILSLIEVTPVHGNTLAIVAAGAASFSLGGLLARVMPRTFLHKKLRISHPKQKKTSESFRKTLMIVLLCALPVMFYQALQLSRSQGGSFNVLLQARQELIEERINNNNSLALFVIGYVSLYALLTSFLFATEKKDRKFWIVTVVAFIACILTTGRVAILILISGLSAIYLIQRKQESLRNAIRFLRWPMTLFALLYIGLIFTNKPTEGMSRSVTNIATEFILGYIVYPLAAFDVVVQNPAQFMETTSHIFDFPLHLIAALHLADYTPPPVSDTFVFVPFPTNVYTMFKFYYLELGLAGTLTFLLIVGMFHSLLYLKARQGGRLSIYLFAYSLYPLLMVIFADQYYLMSVYLRALTFGILYFTIGSVRFHLLRSDKQENLSLQTRL
jgi:oligosaccharide repeat unit polymerase